MTVRRLRVLLDASALPAQPAGAGVYAIQLARALAVRDDIDLIVAAPREIVPAAGHVQSAAGALAPAWEQMSLPRILRKERIDVCHGAHFAVPVLSKTPCVATVHDLTFFRLPARYGWLHRHYYRLLARVARGAARIIVPSPVIAGDAIRFLSCPPERIRVIAEAPRSGLEPAPEADVAALCDRFRIERPYLLCVGTAEPGKRAIDALRALALLHERNVTTTLVIAGKAGPLSQSLRREAGKLAVANHVIFAGYVPDADLAALYTGATALIFPSLYEGFGLPPLEAMVCGTPVISSRAPAMSSVLNGSAIFVPLRSPDAISREAERLLRDRDYRSHWSARGRECAARFSWERTAAETVDVYREVAC